MTDKSTTTRTGEYLPLKPLLDWIDASVKTFGFTTPEQEIARMSTVIESQKRVHKITPRHKHSFTRTALSISGN